MLGLVSSALLSLTLVSCAPAQREAAIDTGGDFESQEDLRVQGYCYLTVPLSLENKLRQWWSGESMDVTWKASVFSNRDWSGKDRPDHAPKDGVNGLMQTADSGPITTKLGVSNRCGLFDSDGGMQKDVLFTLTPTVVIDGQTVELSAMQIGPTLLYFEDFQASRARTEFHALTMVETYGATKKLVQCNTPVTYSQNTARGFFQYTATLKCPPSQGGIQDDSMMKGILTLENYSR